MKLRGLLLFCIISCLQTQVSGDNEQCQQKDDGLMQKITSWIEDNVIAKLMDKGLGACIADTKYCAPASLTCCRDEKCALLSWAGPGIIAVLLILLLSLILLIKCCCCKN
eukprot:TRINITY_DN23835_c0_g1_i1.p1 TRINITY_DN23835_c0_g1~~TRINITY_DN23835_c0_g1_i1.p1  ORF type:complete len:123 (-),score=22.91 TRINITY_DN23835_c0_g1_i1:149-478(-)